MAKKDLQFLLVFHSPSRLIQALQVQVQKTIRQVHPGLLQAMGQMGRQGDSAVTFLIWGGFLLK